MALQHPVPGKQLQHIGDITVSFELLLSEIQSLIWKLLDQDQRVGQIITSELSFRNLLNLLSSLYLEKKGQDDKSEKLNDLLKKANEIEGTRNGITHSIWGAGKDIEHITRIKTTAKQKAGLRFVFEEVSASSLSDFATEIKTLAGEIQEFRLEL